MTQESPETKLLKMAFKGLTGPVELPPAPSPYWNPPNLFHVRDIEFEADIPGIGRAGRRPDVTLVDVDGRRMAVELCNTSPKTESWVRDLASVGMLVIEVDVHNNTPDLGAPSGERVSKLLRAAKWLNPGPDGSGAKSVLQWVPYTNILSYFQACETGLILERDGKEVAIKILFEKGRWRSVVGNSQGREMRAGPAEAAQDAWEAAHSASYPYSSLPPCPTVTSMGINLNDDSPWIERWRGKWLAESYQCATCLGVIPSFELVLNLGAHVNGSRISVISPSTSNNWQGKAMSLYLKHQPDKHYCWVCAAMQTTDDWKPHVPHPLDHETAGEPPGFENFCQWKSAQVEQRRRASYENMPPSGRTDTQAATNMLKDIEDFIARRDLDAALETLRTLKSYSSKGRVRARECAEQIVQGQFRRLPFPLQQAILQ